MLYCIINETKIRKNILVQYRLNFAFKYFQPEADSEGADPTDTNDKLYFSLNLLQAGERDRAETERNTKWRMGDKIKGHTSNDLILIDHFCKSLYRISGLCSLLAQTAVYRLLYSSS